MSKLCSKEKVKHQKNLDENTTLDNIRKKQLSAVYIGTTNVKLWTDIKLTCNFNSDIEFAGFLLGLAQEHLKKDNVNKKHRTHSRSSQNNGLSHTDNNHSSKSGNEKSVNSKKKSKTLHNKKIEKSARNKECSKKEKSKNKRKHNNVVKILEDKKSSEPINVDKDTSKLIVDYPLPMVVVEKIDLNVTKIGKSDSIFSTDKNVDMKKISEINVDKDELINDVINDRTKNEIDNVDVLSVKEDKIEVQDKSKKHKSEDNNHKYKKHSLTINKSSKHKHDKNDKIKRKIKHHDIRKAPELDVKTEIPTEPQVILSIQPVENNITETNSERVSIKIKLCSNCNTRHLQDACPLRNPLSVIQDAISQNDWLQNKDNKNEDISYASENKKSDLDLNLSLGSDDKSFDNSINIKKEMDSFSMKSLPNTFYLEEVDSVHGLSVFTRCEIKEYTQFGPLIGDSIKEVNVAEDFGMKNLWEIHGEKNIYINTEDINSSNWLRYIRPAPTRELRNLAAVSIAEQLFMVTTRNVMSGEELLYWQDDPLGVKKKLEKTNCGGCNLIFAHPLYYRIHCSIFHDIRYSLTIRKYHCKVCGIAVLGKDNIMKHAIELHNGHGAYQCQFCKKFFLRLNYLEMHRTYGCAANPHRSRPLCDFCGRKFCQPQKLKVHIKRMHSDMTEVLREFQCKNCMKLLGSRAALQRHVKEVHHKQVEGACTCIRCGKLFQNKSNLKIHMLTHSGVKPFKCKEENCSAAFTTKQCLQFHYKKVHGFAEDIMPKIERSVEYTFAAYAGIKDNEPGMVFNPSSNKESKVDDSLMCLEESTDVDDISLDDKNLEDPPAIQSPIPLTNEHSSGSDQNQPVLEVYGNSNHSGKILSKGSKKWLGEQLPLPLNLPLQQPIKDVYHFEKEIRKPEDTSNIILDVEDTQPVDRNKLNLNMNLYNRHESSNASLLVEAALDSVSDIQITNTEPSIDVSESQNCTDSLVNNLYSLSHQDNLADVAYNHNEDLNESRDINLISPSVNDHISVTDHELNDDLPNRGITLDYSSLQHTEFSPPNSPELQTRSQLMHDYTIHGNSPMHSPRSRLDYTLNQDTEIVSPNNSSTHYDFHQNTVAENLSSDESNGIVAQNLTINNAKNKLRVDLVEYKNPYGELDSSDLSIRKYESFRSKYDLDIERNKIYELSLDDRNKMFNETNVNNDIRNKFDIVSSTECTSKMYQDSLDSEIRSKQYDSIENTDLKIKQFEIESDFRNTPMIRSNKYDQINTKYEHEMHNKPMDVDVELRPKNFDTLETDRNKTIYDNNVEAELRNKSYDVVESLEMRNKSYENVVDSDFRPDRNFEPLVLNSAELQGLDMSARSYHNFHTSGSIQGINRYHHIYSELERPSVDLRLSYSPPPPYSHSDVLRVVSLDLTPPGRHSVDLSLRTHTLHPHQLSNSRLLSDHPLQTNRLISADHNLSTNRILSEHNRITLDQSRLLNAEHSLAVSSNRLLSSDRLMSDSSNRLISDHTTNRLLSNDQLSSNRIINSDQGRVISDDTRILSEQSRLLDQRGLLNETRILQPTPTNTPSLDLVTRGGLSPGYNGYSVSPSPYHPTSLAPRSHGSSPGHTASTGYHHYSTYY